MPWVLDPVSLNDRLLLKGVSVNDHDTRGIVDNDIGLIAIDVHCVDDVSQVLAVYSAVNLLANASVFSDEGDGSGPILKGSLIGYEIAVRIIFDRRNLDLVIRAGHE